MTAARLTQLSDVTGTVALPEYEPAAHGVGIVHLGLGAFHRAHQAVMTDAAISKMGGDWRIIGVSLRSRAIATALEPQNGLYTLIERSAQGAAGRIIGSIAAVIAADPQATLSALCDPGIRVVTLTVTEKAYGIDRATGAPDRQHPAIAADVASPKMPTGVLGLLTAALASRRATGIAPFTVLCCDNLPNNGRFLQGGVIGFARITDPELADWIETNVDFPACMVDRITPAATQDTLRDATSLTGCIDAAAIETEPFTQWVIEDRFSQGRPAWEHGGAIFVADVEPYEQMKLRMLNGTHTMLAYAGFLSGHRYVRDVMGDPNLARLVSRHLAAAAAVLRPLRGVDFGQYASDLETRFRNPAIRHETYQIAMDGTEKLPQRIFAAAVDTLRAGQDIRPFAFATAAWMRYCLGQDETGKAYALRDPREVEIAAALSAVPRNAQAISSTLHELPALFPDDLKGSPHWRASVEGVLTEMLTNGVAAAVSLEAANG
jgi:fructuronate reductase